MLGIITYGSLINTQEVERQQPTPAQVIPIKLETYKRSFNQRPAWRESTGQNSAVLNVQTSGQSWLNGVCYCFRDYDFAALDIRERGYSRTTVPLDKVNCYQGYNLPELEKMSIYLGKSEYLSNTLLPNPDYLDICLRGAKNWGEIFYQDFLNTTHINSGILLCQYLQPS